MILLFKSNLLLLFRYTGRFHVFAFGHITRQAEVSRWQVIAQDSWSITCMHGGLAPKCWMLLEWVNLVEEPGKNLQTRAEYCTRNGMIDRLHGQRCR